MAKSIKGVLPFLFLAICWSAPLLSYWLVEADYPIFFQQKLSPDEFQYWQEIDSLQLLLNQSNFFNFVFFKEKFGYGTLFWQIYAFLGYPFRDLSLANDGRFILVLRSINLFFQLLTAYFLTQTHKKWSSSLRSLWTLVLAIAFMPGLLIMWKGYSPDYLSACFFVISIFLASCYLKDSDRSNKYLYFSVLFLGLSTSIKLYIGLFLSIFLLLVFILTISRSIKLNTTHFKIVLISIFISFFGVILGNLRLLSDPSSFVHLISVFSSVVNSIHYINAMPQNEDYLVRFFTWFHNPYSKSFISMSSVGILREFLGYSALLLIFISGFLSWFGFRHFKESSLIRRFIIVLFASSLITFVITIFITNRVWSWYLLIPVLILALTSNWILWNSIHKDKSNRFKKISYLTLFITHVLTMGYFSREQYLERMNESEDQIKRLSAEYESCVIPFLKKTNYFKNENNDQPYGFPVKTLYVPYGFPIPVNQYVNVYSTDLDMVNVFGTAKYIFLKGDLNKKLSSFKQNFKISHCQKDVFFLERKE